MLIGNRACATWARRTINHTVSSLTFGLRSRSTEDTGAAFVVKNGSGPPDHARRIAVNVAKLPDSFGEVVNANPGASREPHVMSQNDPAASANASKS
jgi:hypothetical protein